MIGFLMVNMFAQRWHYLINTTLNTVDEYNNSYRYISIYFDKIMIIMQNKMHYYLILNKQKIIDNN